MITTGVIKKINVSGGKHKNNKVIAEVSLFKSPGDTNTDAYNCECNCSVPGGMYSPYNVGDKVYIGFLNGKKTNPIILGKIYQGLEDESRAFAYFNSLKVSDQVNLPENTLLGDLKVTDIKNLDKKIDNLNIIANRFPNPPIVDGEYNLRCSVSGNEGITINSKFISGAPDVKKSIRQSIQTKCGNSVVRNQYAKAKTVSNAGITWTLTDDGTLIFSGTSTVGGLWSMNFIEDVLPKGHKYLLWHSKKSEYLKGWFAWNNNTNLILGDKSNGIYELSNDANDVGLSFQIPEGTTIPDNTIAATNVVIIDLTQWFGSNDNIPQDLLNNPSHFSWYYNGDLSYNTGTLINATGRYLECRQSRNIWDEEWENGYWDNLSGNPSNVNTEIRSKNFIKVFENTEYYFYGAKPGSAIVYFDINGNYISYKPFNWSSIFTTPNNCSFIKINLGASYGTTYNHDITISLYYTPGQGGEGYDKYYPYIAPKVVDTGSEILRSACNIYDYKTSDGTITRRVGRVDLGTLDWLYVTSGKTRFNSSPIDDIVKISGDTTVGNIICPIYLTGSPSEVYTGSAGIATKDKALWVYNTSYTDAATFKAAMSGVYLYYELETPTTEQGISFQEDITINDYSYMLWKDANDNLANIPQGCDIFYLQKEGGEIRYY